MTRKDYLKRNLERVMKLSSKCAKVFNVLPLTFALPKEYVPFME